MKISFKQSAIAAFLVLGLILPFVKASAPTAASKEVHPLRDAKGRALFTEYNQLQSGNWSGYATASFQTSRKYTQATGNWVVPSAVVPPGESAGYSSSWVGIGGFCIDANCNRVDNSLIQLGTEQDANSSGANYYAWYEMLPNPEIPISGFAVNPGDSITASLQVVGGNGNKKIQTWQLSIVNNTTRKAWGQKFNYKSSLASAEWIEEAPYSGGILPLANYSTATFDPGTVNGGQNPGLTPAQAVVMVNQNGQTSNVSAPDSDTDGFNACWGNGSTFTTCDAPQS